MKIIKKISLLFFLLLLLIIPFEKSFGEEKKSKEPFDPFKIKERVVLGGSGTVNVQNELNSILPAIEEECSDVIDEETGELISEGYFNHSIDTNSIYLEIDKETGYTVGEGIVAISYSKKCPASFIAAAFKDSGTVKAEFSFKAPKAADGSVSGTYKLKLKIPTKIGFSKTLYGQWNGIISDDRINGDVSLSVGIAGIGFDAKLPFSVPIKSISDPKLIEFALGEEPVELSILDPYSVGLFANGEDSQEFTAKAESKMLLINKRNSDTIDQIIIGIPDIPIKIKMAKFWIRGVYLKPDWGLLNGNDDKNLELTTDDQGEAKFTYTTPNITDKYYEEAEITLHSQSSKTKGKNGPPAYITLKKAMGKIRGRLVDYEGNPLDHDMILTLLYPGDAPVKEKEVVVTVKKGKSTFEIPTTYVSDDYQLIIEPPEYLSDLIPRKDYFQLNYDVDLGTIVIASIEQFEKAVINDVRKFLKKAGLLNLAEDKLATIKFSYDTKESSNLYYTHNDNTVHLPNQDVWLTPNRHDYLERTYHEIFHAVHAQIAFDDLNWVGKTNEFISRAFTLRGDKGDHKMWEENENLFGLDKTELTFNESISNFMAHLMMKDLGIGFSKMHNPDSGLSDAITREDFYLKGSITSRNKDKTGETVEGKIVAFLIDYYNEKDYTPAETLQDFFITTRDFSGYGGVHNASDIQEWIVSKMISAHKENDSTDLSRLRNLMSKHNITSDPYHHLHYFDFTSNQLIDTIDRAIRQGTDKERQKDKVAQLKTAQTKVNTAMKNSRDSLSNNDLDQANKYLEEAKQHMDEFDAIYNDTTFTVPENKSATQKINKSSYTVSSGASYKPDASYGGMYVESGQMTVRVPKDGVGVSRTNDGSFKTDGTVYSVEKIPDATILKVAEGKVAIVTSGSKQTYVARAGEEVEVKSDSITPIRTFDPATQPEFKRGIFDYLTVQNLALVGGGLLGVLVVLFIVKKIVRRKK